MLSHHFARLLITPDTSSDGPQNGRKPGSLQAAFLLEDDLADKPAESVVTWRQHEGGEPAVHTGLARSSLEPAEVESTRRRRRNLRSLYSIASMAVRNGRAAEIASALPADKVVPDPGRGTTVGDAFKAKPERWAKGGQRLRFIGG